MCVDPYVADRIKELDIQPGELFLVCKRKAKNGNRKTIHWVVERLGDYEDQLERDLRESLARATQPSTASITVPSSSSIATAETDIPPHTPLPRTPNTLPQMTEIQR